ncbi:hypothetical protein [Microbacterium sp. G2-8]|uniref:hypothetical protein n=1 Tax=Microbacterium sp. G2-8 TaxID=2842454 RepID=UPI001C8A7AB7|nr:hypothetical protein [Microbacterium sp. G2-8]
MLDEIGLPLGGDDEAVLRSVITHPARGIDELAAEAGLAPDAVAAALERLGEHDVVVALDGGGWEANAPDFVLSPHVDRARERVRRAERAVADLIDTYHRERAARSGMELVEILDGPETQARRLLELEFGPTREIRAMQSGANAAIGTRHAAANLRVNARARYRFVVDAAYLAEPAAVELLQGHLSRGADVRVADRVSKLIIADDHSAMIQLDGAVAAVLRPPLVSLAIDLFETTWRAARPYADEDVAGPSESDRHLLQLMLAGLTDQAIAAQLATSPRTLQRRIRALMDDAGVVTRMQLGGYAVRSGWI